MRIGAALNIALIGYRGSGKTSTGREVARALGMGFVDTDVEIVTRAGRTIKEIFESAGEREFREMEASVVEEVARWEGVVIACGGGVVLRAENVAALKATCRIVLLEADAGTLWQRISADVATKQSRPNLTAAGGVEEIAALLKVREPLYRAAADVVVDVRGKTAEEVARGIMAVLGMNPRGA